jgi:hypothetical protein
MPCLWQADECSAEVEQKEMWDCGNTCLVLSLQQGDGLLHSICYNPTEIIHFSLHSGSESSNWRLNCLLEQSAGQPFIGNSLISILPMQQLQVVQALLTFANKQQVKFSLCDLGLTWGLRWYQHQLSFSTRQKQGLIRIDQWALSFDKKQCVPPNCSIIHVRSSRPCLDACVFTSIHMC